MTQAFMKTVFKLHTAFLLLGLLCALTPTATGQDAASRIKSQIDHLRQALENESGSRPEWKEAKPDIAESLQRADDALRAGRLYLSLEKLADAYRGIRDRRGATMTITYKGLPTGNNVSRLLVVQVPVS